MFTILVGSVLMAGCENSKNQTSEIKVSRREKEIELLDVRQEEPEILFEKIDIKYISSNFKFKGKPVEYLKWTDARGSYVAFTTLTNITGQVDPDSESYGRSRYLNCYHFIETEGLYNLSWVISDFVKNCPVDLTLSFIKKSLHITDLNKNGIGEIWTMYRKACRGGVDPSALILSMYEGSTRYQIEGESKVELSKTDTYGGEITRTQGFKIGDPSWHMRRISGQGIQKKPGSDLNIRSSLFSPF